MFLGYDVKSGQPVAIKVMDTGTLLSKNPKLAVYLKNELDILGTLNCDNIVKLYDVVVSTFPPAPTTRSVTTTLLTTNFPLSRN